MATVDSEGYGQRGFTGSETIVTQLCKRTKRYQKSMKGGSEEHAPGIDKSAA